MRTLRFAIAALCALAIAAPATSSAATITLGWSWWSTASASQKAGVVQGELAGILAGYDQSTFIVEITAALTGNSALSKVSKQLQKSVPRYSNTVSQYVADVNSAYANPNARKLTIGFVLLCYEDPGPGVVTGSSCLTQWENSIH